MFQAYKMKMVRTPAPVRAYRYKNCSIAFSKQAGQMVVSIAPHGNPMLPDKEEVAGILSYLGLDPAKPYETYRIEHRGDPTYGDTQYFVQPA